jgi:hypothetical protein
MPLMEAVSFSITTTDVLAEVRAFSIVRASSTPWETALELNMTPPSFLVCS